MKNIYKVVVNEGIAINLSAYEGTGYKIDIINKPGDCRLSRSHRDFSWKSSCCNI